MKNIYIFLLAFLPLSLLAQNLNDSLLVHYQFNGNTTDISGNAWDGIPSNNLTYTADRAGNPGQAVYFNGVNSFVDMPGVAQLKPQFPMSFSFWVRPDNLAIPAAMFTTDFHQNNYHGAWVNYDPNGSGTMAVSFGNGAGNTGSQSRRSYFGNIAIQQGVWSHVVAVIRGVSDMDLYINCQKDNGAYSGSATNIVYSTDPGSLGRNDTQTNAPAWYYEGGLDDFRYWNRALTDTEALLLCEELPVALDEATLSTEFHLVPNPGHGDQIRIVTDLPSLTTVRVTDMLGKVLIQTSFQETLTVSQLPAGVYTVSIADDAGNVLHRKLVRE